MSFASVLARMKNRGLFLAILFLLPLLRGQNSASVPPFRDPDLSPEEPAADLVGSLTLQEKVLPMRNSVPAIVPLDIPAYDWWNEAGAAWWARAGMPPSFRRRLAWRLHGTQTSCTGCPMSSLPTLG
jgi:hypothetical protein